MDCNDCENDCNFWKFGCKIKKKADAILYNKVRIFVFKIFFLFSHVSFLHICHRFFHSFGMCEL